MSELFEVETEEVRIEPPKSIIFYSSNPQPSDFRKGIKVFLNYIKLPLPVKFWKGKLFGLEGTWILHSRLDTVKGEIVDNIFLMDHGDIITATRNSCEEISREEILGCLLKLHRNPITNPIAKFNNQTALLNWEQKQNKKNFGRIVATAIQNAGFIVPYEGANYTCKVTSCYCAVCDTYGIIASDSVNDKNLCVICKEDYELVRSDPDLNILISKHDDENVYKRIFLNGACVYSGPVANEWLGHMFSYYLGAYNIEFEEGCSEADQDIYLETITNDNEDDYGDIPDYGTASPKLNGTDTYNGPFIGVELEFETPRRQLRSDACENIKSNLKLGRKNFVHIERDGSLNPTYGAEIVSDFTDLKTLEKVFVNGFNSGAFRGCKSHNGRQCGLHVSMSRSYPKKSAFKFFTIGDNNIIHPAYPDHLHEVKMIKFWSSDSIKPLIMAVARRWNAEYAYMDCRNPKDLKETLNRYNNTADKYRHVFINGNRIEIRVFRGTLIPETFCACLELSWASYWFCKDMPLSKINVDDFLGWLKKPEVQSNTQYLRWYLKGKGFDIPVKVDPNKKGKEKKVCA